MYSIDFNGYIFNISGKINSTLLVDKQKQRLFVLAENGAKKIEIKDEFRITTGKSFGDKVEEGDNKTPEGIYTLIRKLDGNLLPEKYGPLAFIIDYPNTVDRLDKKTGSNIWIHGRNEAIKDHQTEGCISLENSHILDLAKYVTLNETKIIIVDSLRNDDLKSILENKKLQDFLLSWAENWSKGNLDNYFNNYSVKFRENGNSFNSFKNRKKQIEKIYKWKKVNLDSIYFIISEKEIQAYFQQTYISPKFVSVGEKVLTIINENNEYKIVRENFRRIGRRVEFSKELKSFVDRWRLKWESRNINEFITFYDEKFNIKNKDKNWLYEDKKVKFAKANKITVQITNFHTYSTKENQWFVTFNQRYQADNYKDYGRKTLIVEKQENGKFLIISEMWRAEK